MTELPAAEVAVSEVTLNVVVDLHSSASTVLNNDTSDYIDLLSAGEVDRSCSAPLQLNLKLPELGNSSSNESNDEVTLTTDARQETGDCARAASSPSPNCAICLGRCKNKCFTDSCMHQFCFKCLCEWSNVKPVCPLCKQTFKSIKHNVKSNDQFDEYLVPPPIMQCTYSVPNMTRHNERNLELPPYPLNINNIRQRLLAFSHNNWPRNRLITRARVYLAIFEAEQAAILARRNRTSNNANIDFEHHGDLWEMIHQVYPHGGIATSNLSQLWRTYIYDRKLYALPLCDITGRFRDSSAEIYRDNPSQLNRLLPWITRDIICLLRDAVDSAAFVLNSINYWLTTTNILSPVFRRRLQPLLGINTLHFIHELNNFARSTYDMIGYDSAVQYSPQSTEEIVIDEDAINVIDGGSVSDGDGTHPSGNNPEVDTMANISPVINFLSMPPVEGEYVLVDVPHSQSAAVNLSMHNGTSDIIDLSDTDMNQNGNTTADAGVLQISSPSEVNYSIVTPTLPPSTITENIELFSDSSSDECEFVLEFKPLNLQTPEIVNLNSGSDSDVMIVEDDISSLSSQDGRNPLELEETMQKNEQQSEEGINVEDQELDLEEVNLGASTSTGLPSSGWRRRQKFVDVKKNIIKILKRRCKRSRRSNKESRSTESSSSDSATEDDGEVYTHRLMKKPGECRRITRGMTLRTAASKTENVKTNRIRKGSGVVNESVRRKVKQRFVGDDSEESEDINVTNILERMDSGSREICEECIKILEGSTEDPSIQELTLSFALPENAHVHDDEDVRSRGEMNETSIVNSSSSCTCRYCMTSTSDTSESFISSLQSDSNF